MQKDTIKYITRVAELKIKSELDSGKVVIILGARQVGKTTLIKEVLKTRNASYLNFDIEIDKQRFLAASKLDPESDKIRHNHDIISGKAEGELLILI